MSSLLLRTSAVQHAGAFNIAAPPCDVCPGVPEGHTWTLFANAARRADAESAVERGAAEGTAAGAARYVRDARVRGDRSSTFVRTVVAAFRGGDMVRRGRRARGDAAA